LIFVRFVSRETSSLPLSAWGWACGAALISMTRWIRVFCEALPMQQAPLHRQIFLWFLCVRRLDSAIFLESQKRLLRFAIFHLPVSLLESQWALRLTSQTRLHRYAKHCGQELGASWPTHWLRFLLWQSAIFLVWEMKRLSRLTPIRRGDFFVLH
jgi:hypothetical protein